MSKYKLIIILTSIILYFGFAQKNTVDPPKEKINIDLDWKFKKGDFPNALQPGFDDSETFKGVGHPSIESTGRYVITITMLQKRQ